MGSTAIRTICAKPILDIAVGVREPEDVMRFAEPLAEIGIRCSKRDVAEQILFVMGDFARGTRTHHIHVVQWDGAAWHNYLNFRDYLNAFPEKAKEYEERKRTLAAEFADARGSYTAGKQTLIESLLKEAADWRKMRAGTRGALAEVAR